MTSTTVVHDTDSLLNLARLGDDTAWPELARRCTVPAFDPAALQGASEAFSGPRRVQASRLSAASGVLVHNAREDRYFIGEAHRVGLGAREGRTFTVTLGPGLASLAVTEAVRAEHAVQRVRDAVTRGADLLAGVLANEPGYRAADTRSRFVMEWSRKSRTRMLRAFVSVDWSALDIPGAPLGMVTLTYPGDWLAVAPNGRTVKRHLKAFRQRYGRALGRRLDGAWKLEFQGRGAPHFHLLMPCPALVKGEAFEAWVARTWASIVGADNTECSRCGSIAACTDDAGNRSCSTEFTRHTNAGTGIDFGPTARSSDVKRLGIYFMKHGTKTADDKEYQHYVPKAWLVDDNGELTPENGPGRFWGMWGLKPATVVVEIDADDFVAARRVLRKVAAARARSIAYKAARREGASPRAAVARRRGRSRVLTGSRMVGGFVVVNDGVRLGEDLARAINLARGATLPWQRLA